MLKGTLPEREGAAANSNKVISGVHCDIINVFASDRPMVILPVMTVKEYMANKATACTLLFGGAAAVVPSICRNTQFN